MKIFIMMENNRFVKYVNFLAIHVKIKIHVLHAHLIIDNYHIVNVNRDILIILKINVKVNKILKSNYIIINKVYIKRMSNVMPEM